MISEKNINRKHTYEKKFFPPRPKYKPNSPPLTFVCEVIIQTLDLMLQGRFKPIVPDKISQRKRVYFSNRRELGPFGKLGRVFAFKSSVGNRFRTENNFRDP